jgi:hypothetical protein
VVVVSVLRDPATPYEAGVRLAEQLGGNPITVDGDGHTVVLDGVACVDDAVTAYLVDLTPPAEDLRCGSA